MLYSVHIHTAAIFLSILIYLETCKLVYENPDNLKRFQLLVRPDEGHWKRGVFKFDITVPSEYNNKVSSIPTIPARPPAL